MLPKNRLFIESYQLSYRQSQSIVGLNKVNIYTDNTFANTSVNK